MKFYVGEHHDPPLLGHEKLSVMVVGADWQKSSPLSGEYIWLCVYTCSVGGTYAFHNLRSNETVSVCFFVPINVILADNSCACTYMCTQSVSVCDKAKANDIAWHLLLNVINHFRNLWTIILCSCIANVKPSHHYLNSPLAIMWGSFFYTSNFSDGVAQTLHQ